LGCLPAVRGVTPMAGPFRAGETGLFRCPPFLLDCEPQVAEHLDCTGLAALKVAGGETLTRRELVRCAEDRFRRITALVRHKLICGGRRKAVCSEERLRADSVVLVYRALHVFGRHLLPRHHVLSHPPRIVCPAWPPSPQRSDPVGDDPSRSRPGEYSLR